jgi:glycosyltransferase involved in cell wall biosynthesis
VTKAALQDATVLVSMMSHLLEWGVKKYAERNLNSDDRVFFIVGDDSNNNRCQNPDQLFPEIEGGIRGRFVVNYVGSFSHLNQPMVIIEAAKYLNALGHKDRILFILAGHGDYYERCVNVAQGHGNVVFLGWVNADKITALNSISSVGVFPSAQEFAFPNKAFSYLGAGLPVLSSEHGDLNSLLEKYKAGYYFDITDPIQLANKILSLSMLDHEAYNKISENAKSLFQDYLRADKIYREYADYVEYIANKYRCGKKIG